MKNKIYIVITVLAVIVVGIILFLSLSKKGDTPAPFVLPPQPTVSKVPCQPPFSPGEYEKCYPNPEGKE